MQPAGAEAVSMGQPGASTDSQTMVYPLSPTRRTKPGISRTPSAEEAVRRIIIAKPFRLYAEALVGVCRQAFPSAEVAVHCRGLDTLAALRERPADLLVIGLAFPDIDGLELLEPVAHEKLATRVLVDSPRRDEYSLLVLRTARFDGFIDAAAEGLEQMDHALRAVMGGQGYISASVRETLVERPAASALGRRLTNAEIHVLSVIGDGSDNDEGAERLGLSASTVQTHRRNIMRKLGVSTSAKLVREAVRLGVVRITPRGVIRRAAAQHAAPEATAAEHPLVPAAVLRVE